jgi:hypothetical protein
MSKTRDTGFLGNVVKYDANGNVTIVNGATTLLSVSSSGQLTVPGDEVITGSLTVLGGITGAITGSATSASYAANASLLNGSGSGEFVPTGSFNTFSSSILTYTGSVDSRLGSLETTSGSNITRLSSIESTTGSLNTASGSAITRLNALEVTSGSNITRLSALETASGSAITRLNSIESKTGSYATTGSNTFDGGQYFSSSFNPTGFSTTASLYTDGGLRVTRDAYISGTLYLNNVTVFGTQSVAYISSSQLNIGTNLITVNTDTPSIRFGGLAVYDSGSTGLTGSILWDSQNNHWVYSNPSGSSYSGGMFISGPRSAALGSETGTTSCMLLAGQGGDHLTSSMIYHSSTVTCIPNTLAGGVGCFSGAVCTLNASVSSCLGVGVSSPQGNFEVVGLSYFTRSNNSLLINPNYGGAGTHAQLQVGCNMALAFATCGDNERMRITSDGVVGIGTNAPVIQDGNLAVAGCVGTGQGITCTTAQINIWETTSGNKAGLWFGAVNCANVGVIGSRTATGNIAFQTYCGAWAERMRITYNGNVGIGTTIPVIKLDVQSSSSGTGLGDGMILKLKNTSTTANTRSGINFGNIDGIGGSLAMQSAILKNAATGEYDMTWDLYGGAAGWKEGLLYLDSNPGNVGIGTSAPDFPLSVFGTNIAQGDSSITAHFIDKSSFAAGVGGGIAFGGYYASSTYANSFAYIQGIKENGTSGDYAGALKFGTRVNGGSVTERLRISSTGEACFSSTIFAASFSASNPSLTRSNLNIDRATKVITSFNATASGARWLRVGCFNARTTYLMSFGTTGNYYTPGSTTFLMFRDWGNGFFTSTLGKLGEQYVFCTRFQSDNVGDTYALEVWMNPIIADQLNGVLVYSAATLAGNPDNILMCLGSYGTSLANAANTSTAILL